ncbi:HepT-like ribonuclease domain-containing protein [Mesotoga sp.]|uniref:HepT-like ribonuclease domain-containing protein n=1 Tax=Mesotoga sp. TaxID=2053577 RepID=UPI00261B88EB|nr:HepT-like ribonuclease domain-containing protein [Mesotoga sp.]
MSRREIAEILEDIVDSIERITAYVDNMSYDEFMADLKTQDAVIRNIEIIEEAAKQLPLPSQ